jgi:DNA-binding PadR family transcriptional regulator
MALSHAILAILLDKPCSGYDLRKRFEGSVGFFWQASFQQIYRELSKLEEQGFISFETIHQQNRPDKRLYQMTEAGEACLKAWIAEPCDTAPLRDDLLVKTFSGYAVPVETFLTELRQHQRQHQERLMVYQQIEDSFFPNPQALPVKAKFQYLTLLNGIRFETSWLAWYDEALSLLSELSAKEEAP